MGNLQSHQGRHDEAGTSYTTAIAAYDRALQIAPDDAEIHNNRGTALEGLGDLRSGLGQLNEAESSYSNAVVAYDRALQIAPDYVSALWNKARFLETRGEARLRSSRSLEARHLFQQAMEGHRRLREIARTDSEIKRQTQALEEMIAAIDEGPGESLAKNP